MAFYAEEEEVWKCPKHPSRRRRTGVCHVCLRDRLSSLCPHCATVRPCSCCSATSSSSRFSNAASESSVGRVSSLIETEPALRRSRSVAVQFFRSNPAGADHDYASSKDGSKKTPSFSSVFRVFRSSNKSKRVEELRASGFDFQEEGKKISLTSTEEEERRRMVMMRKSRSVAVTSDPVGADVRPTTKGKGWHFPSPMKVFRQSISRGFLLERSPLYRG